MIVCINCGRKYIYSRSSGHTLKQCNTCLVNYRRFKRKLKIIKYLGGSCWICGYDKCPIALEVHHVKDDLKSFNISGSHCRSWKTVKFELDRCDCILLCSNCHREQQYLGSKFEKYMHGRRNGR